MAARARVLHSRRRPRHGEPAEAEPHGRAPSAPESKALPEDLLSLYFAELRKVRLLTSEEESSLARQIEAGREAEARLADEGAQLDVTTRAELCEQATQGREAFDSFVSANLRLVVAEATKFGRRSHLDLDELIQEGNLGLIRAVEKFDWRRGLRFSTYATWWIQKALQRGTAQHERTIRLPAGVHASLLKVRAAQSRLWGELGRAPCMAELAEATNLSGDEVRDALAADLAVLSLDKPVSDEDDSCEWGGMLARATDSPHEEVVDRLFVEDVLATGRRELPERSWYVLCRRYELEGHEAKTLVELGKELGVSRETVRTIEQQALGQLLRALQRPSLPAGGTGPVLHGEPPANVPVHAGH
ncbi:MAG TPA: sigma-70 family RNA polymerase sigma factor [Egibacteraceae bacterium]|jgi:RNA polymerase nonessential primary-like sigma factor|nr:sigma-70 family RNA polymerase sigma factor [Egibacteraceae bacterium]